MSRRLASPLYAGARGACTLHRAARLGPWWALTPKYDGSLVTARTDAAGAVTHLWTRNGLELGCEQMADFAGVRWAPGALLVAEAELWSEAANRIAAARGYRMLHVFDALRLGGHDVSGLPYQERRDALLRAEAELQAADPDQTWFEDRAGRARDLRKGHFVAPVPHCWRRVRVVPQMPADQADAAWASWVELGADPVEGLVAVALRAPVGARAAKLKVKPLRTIEATVVRGGERALVLRWAGGTFVQAWAKGARTVHVGDVVEVACQGFTERSATPKHARVLRARPDLSPARAP